jgi:hypothetical protein
LGVRGNSFLVVADDKFSILSGGAFSKKRTVLAAFDDVVDAVGTLAGFAFSVAFAREVFFLRALVAVVFFVVGEVAVGMLPSPGEGFCDIGVDTSDHFGKVAFGEATAFAVDGFEEAAVDGEEFASEEVEDVDEGIDHADGTLG